VIKELQEKWNNWRIYALGYSLEAGNWYVSFNMNALNTSTTNQGELKIPALLRREVS